MAHHSGGRWKTGGPPCSLWAIVVLGVLVRKVPSREYCVPHLERPCWGVRKSLTQRSGVDNPFHSTDDIQTLFQSVDWDGDGRVDLLVRSNNEVRVYLGGANGSSFSQHRSIDLEGELADALHAVDWDGDGHMDILMPSVGTLRFYRGGTNGSFSQRTGADNPFAHLNTGQTDEDVHSQVMWLQAVDWDGDGRLDLLLGSMGDGVRLFRGQSDGTFSQQVDAFVGLGREPFISPHAMDWDGDGRIDLLVRPVFSDRPRLFRRNADGSLSAEGGEADPFADIVPERFMWTMQAVDWDGDGHMDLLLHNWDSTSLHFFQGGEAASDLREQTGTRNPFNGVSGGFHPQAADWDGDGRLDLLLTGMRPAAANGHDVLVFIRFFLGRTDGGVVEQIGADNPFAGINALAATHFPFCAVDWDGDGRQDLLFKPYGSRIVRFFAGGTGSGLSERTGPDNPFAAIELELYDVIGSADWDGDGHMDLFAWEYGGTPRFFSGGTNGSLEEQTGTDNPFAAIEAGGLQVVDWDGDGQQDLLLSDHPIGGLRFFRGANGSLSEVTGEAKPLVSLGKGAWLPHAVDWDGDGRMDLLVNQIFESRIRYFSVHCDSTASGQRAVCSHGGWCEPLTGRCECAASNSHPSVSDCSVCADYYFKERGTVMCQPCPGTGTSRGPCSRRGTCFDARTAREAQREGAWTPWQAQAPGNGTCACAYPFSGSDCGEGQCPAGSSLTVVDTHINRSSGEACVECATGQFKAKAGNGPCGPCVPGTFQNLSGATTCDRCPLGKKQSFGGSPTCEDCPAGSVPNANQSECEACGAGRQAGPGQENCSLCEAGKAPTVKRDACQQCGIGEFFAQDKWECQPCSALQTSRAGSTSCRPHWAVTPGVVVMLLAAGTVGLRLLWRCRSKRALAQAMQGSSPDKLRKALERGSKAGLGRTHLQHAQGCLRVLERKYVDYEHILNIVAAGDLKLLKGSWLAKTKNGQRLRRQQDVPPEAFWAADDLRSELRAVLFVAVSYCWLHEVHPDPTGAHLRTLRHAIKLRLSLKGPGQVVDIALFLDFCSLAQHGERGDPAHPERGDSRPPELQASFSKGLRHINVLYANQSVEVWMMQWTPSGETRKYMMRGWPFFEQAVAALIKDAAQLLLILPESEKCRDWLELHRTAIGGRQPPLTPAQFNDSLELKTFTNANTDKAFVIGKYQETFHEVLGHVATLWFSNLGWGDEQAEQLAQVLPHCCSLEHLFLGYNHITVRGATALAAAARACPVRGMDLSHNLIEEHDESSVRWLWQMSGKDPGRLHTGRTLITTFSGRVLTL